MASKYVTDDGLDLDSRYLGINAKAKSAESADIATEAETVKSVEWSSISDAPVLWPKFNYGAVISTNIQYNRKTWTAPSDGFIGQLCTRGDSGKTMSSLYVIIDGKNFPAPGVLATEGIYGWFPINKGSTLTLVGSQPTYFSFIPIVSE